MTDWMPETVGPWVGEARDGLAHRDASNGQPYVSFWNGEFHGPEYGQRPLVRFVARGVFDHHNKPELSATVLAIHKAALGAWLLRERATRIEWRVRPTASLEGSALEMTEAVAFSRLAIIERVAS